MIERWAGRQRALTFIDVEPAMLDADGVVRGELFKSDRLHMNDAGYAIWAELLRPVLDRLGIDRPR
jgi:lysophospholipase L1-like esterase